MPDNETSSGRPASVVQAARDLGMEPSWEPTPGYYRTRLVAKGPLVGARIMCEAGAWMVLINGVPTDSVARQNPWDVRGMDRIGLYGHPITAAEYEALRAASEAAPPDHPLAQPDRPIDLRAAPSIYQRRKP